MDNENQKEGAQAHWIVYEHIDRRVNPISDRLITLEVERRHLDERMNALEEYFKRHMAKEEEHWKQLCEAISEIKKTIARAVWIGTGGIGVLAFLWLFGRQVLDVWIKISGG